MDVILRPADAVRRQLWRLGCRFRFGRVAVQDRSFRLAIVAGTHLVVAFVLALVAPLWLLLLGPIVLGVPHVVSDLRYLVVRPPVPMSRVALGALFVPLAAMTLFRVVAAAGGPLLMEAEILCGGLAVVGALALAPGPAALRIVLVPAAVGLTVFGMSAPFDTALAFGHAHNFIAFGLWVFLAKGDGPWRHVAPVGLFFAAGALFFLLGGGDDLALSAFASDAGGLTTDYVAASLAPEMDPIPAYRLIMLFAFAQSVHYAVWLRLVPQRLSERQPPPTLKRATRELDRDFGRRGFVVIVVATVAIPLLALVDASETRNLYLFLALFHGWLELAVFSRVLVARQARRA